MREAPERDARLVGRPLRIDVDPFGRPASTNSTAPSVSDGPGATAFTRIPSGPSSSAIDFVSPQIACFDVP